jgi:spore germination cell wall hydrolase CwlJ-like protein
LNIIKTASFVATLFVAGCAGSNGMIVANATTQDQKCLAEAIYFEAGSEPTVGQHAVGQVIINRSHSNLYPNSICGVVYQRNYKQRGCQFSWTCRKHRQPHGQAWEHSQEVARLLLIGKEYDMSHGALNFHNRSIKHSYSTRHYVKTALIGHHVFWRPKNSKAFESQGE